MSVTLKRAKLQKVHRCLGYTLRALRGTPRRIAKVVKWQKAPQRAYGRTFCSLCRVAQASCPQRERKLLGQVPVRERPGLAQLIVMGYIYRHVAMQYTKSAMSGTSSLSSSGKISIVYLSLKIWQVRYVVQSALVCHSFMVFFYFKHSSLYDGYDVYVFIIHDQCSQNLIYFYFSPMMFSDSSGDLVLREVT